MADPRFQYSGSANGLVCVGDGSGNSNYQSNAVSTTRQNSQENGKREDKGISESKKPCNCKNSKCLQLYCECFGRQEYCQDCNCEDCGNTPEHKDDVNKAREVAMSRTADAFEPKVIPMETRFVNGMGMTVLTWRHRKGCNCKQSQCLKGYCVCLQARVGCYDRCKCQGCKNPNNGSRGDMHHLVRGGQHDTHAHANLRLSKPMKPNTRDPIPIDQETVGEGIIVIGNRMPPSLLENNQMDHANMAGNLPTIQFINNMQFQYHAPEQQQYNVLDAHIPDPRNVDKWQFNKQ